MTVQKHNDEYGWKRGLGAYSKDDKEFGSPGHKYDKTSLGSEYGSINSAVGGPAGKLLAGAGPVSRGGPPKFRPKSGPIHNASKPK
jgi:hypothetical protein